MCIRVLNIDFKIMFLEGLDRGGCSVIPGRSITQSKHIILTSKAAPATDMPKPMAFCPII
jgi:hypothetical protein